MAPLCKGTEGCIPFRAGSALPPSLREVSKIFDF